MHTVVAFRLGRAASIAVGRDGDSGQKKASGFGAPMPSHVLPLRTSVVGGKALVVDIRKIEVTNLMTLHSSMDRRHSIVSCPMYIHYLYSCAIDPPYSHTESDLTTTK